MLPSLNKNTIREPSLNIWLVMKSKINQDLFIASKNGLRLHKRLINMPNATFYLRHLKTTQRPKIHHQRQYPVIRSTLKTGHPVVTMQKMAQ